MTERIPYSEQLFLDPSIEWLSPEAKELAHKSQDTDRDVWDLVDEVFEMQHEDAVIALKTALYGLKFGYPLCCVVAFISCKHGLHKKLVAGDIGEDGRVLCDKCKELTKA